MNLVKLALRRDPSYPVGIRAPLHVECPCGRTVRESKAGFLCPNCGAVYDHGGWVVSAGKAPGIDPLGRPS